MLIILASLIVQVLCIDWNNKKCKMYLESSATPLILLKDLKANKIKHITRLPYPSYMHSENLLNVYYFHNKLKVMSFELLNATESENCPYKIINTPLHRNLASCSSYSDCYDCIADSGCTWISSTNWGGNCNGLSRYTEWYFKLSRCLNLRDAPHCKHCPKGSTVSNDYSRTIELPSREITLPRNSFCYWEISNPDNKQIELIINKDTVNLNKK